MVNAEISGPAPKPKRIDLAKLVEDAAEDARKVESTLGRFSEGPGNSVVYEHDLSGLVSDVFLKLREDEDRVITDAVILHLRSLGYTVTPPINAREVREPYWGTDREPEPRCPHRTPSDPRPDCAECLPGASR